MPPWHHFSEHRDHTLNPNAYVYLIPGSSSTKFTNKTLLSPPAPGPGGLAGRQASGSAVFTGIWGAVLKKQRT